MPTAYRTTRPILLALAGSVAAAQAVLDTGADTKAPVAVAHRLRLFVFEGLHHEAGAEGVGAAAAGFSSTGAGTAFLTDSCHRGNPSRSFFGAATVKPSLVAHCCISPASDCSGTTITSSSSAANSCSASLAWGNR